MCIVATEIPFLYEDQHLVVLNKPAGLLSQGESTGDENLVDLLRVRFGRNYVGLVHRLDRNTSGLMVVAKRSKAANRLTESLQRGKLIRRYLCVVEGKVLPPTGYVGRAGSKNSPSGRGADQGWTELSHWLVKNEKTNLSKAYQEMPSHLRGARGDAAPKQATLRYRLTDASGAALGLTTGNLFRVGDEPVTVLEIDLDTGRSHQIRAQLAAEGYPLLGDVKYGAKRALPEHRIALHSHSILFPHPMAGAKATTPGGTSEETSALERNEDSGPVPEVISYRTGLADDLARLIQA